MLCYYLFTYVLEIIKMLWTIFTIFMKTYCYFMNFCVCVCVSLFHQKGGAKMFFIQGGLSMEVYIIWRHIITIKSICIHFYKRVLKRKLKKKTINIKHYINLLPFSVWFFKMRLVLKCVMLMHFQVELKTLKNNNTRQFQEKLSSSLLLFLLFLSFPLFLSLFPYSFTNKSHYKLKLIIK